jgi:hypothetical protein
MRGSERCFKALSRDRPALDRQCAGGQGPVLWALQRFAKVLLLFESPSIVSCPVSAAAILSECHLRGVGPARGAIEVGLRLVVSRLALDKPYEKAQNRASTGFRLGFCLSVGR